METEMEKLCVGAEWQGRRIILTRHQVVLARSGSDAIIDVVPLEEITKIAKTEEKSLGHDALNKLDNIQAKPKGNIARLPSQSSHGEEGLTEDEGKEYFALQIETAKVPLLCSAFVMRSLALTNDMPLSGGIQQRSHLFLPHRKRGRARQLDRCPQPARQNRRSAPIYGDGAAVCGCSASIHGGNAAIYGGNTDIYGCSATLREPILDEARAGNNSELYRATAVLRHLRY
eukprot:776027-Rhodomonas_salina.2